GGGEVLVTARGGAVSRGLWVSVGAWTRDAVRAVGAGGAVDRHDVIDVIGRLVDKSLVLMDDQGTESRYRLLETIRQYALERLAETGGRHGARAPSRVLPGLRRERCAAAAGAGAGRLAGTTRG